ncbi:MAG: hypothetical protein D6679_14570 [Candidatus Hydrogenedentota bacterium]|nr:MAG: hypothetical protein D6679_14570 [Candidatus Hydrogenedentota bacterium]
MKDGRDTSVTISHKILKASAGTGKTHALSRRYLEILEAGDPPATILASTFTRKAAGEIAERVLLSIAKSVPKTPDFSDEKDVPVKRRHAAERILDEICDTLDLLKISTLDSFFYQVLLRFRYELGLGSGIEVMEEEGTGSTDLLWEVLAEFFEERREEELFDLVFDFSGGQATKAVTSNLLKTVDALHETYREAPEERIWCRFPVSGRELSETETEAVLERMRNLWKNESGDWNGHLRNAFKKFAEEVKERKWEDLFASGFFKAVLTESNYHGKPLPAKMTMCLKPLVEHVRFVLTSRIQAQAQALWKFASGVGKRYDALRRRRNRLFFSDFTHLLLDAARNGRDLIQAASEEGGVELRHILLDEFQDTSMTQWSLLRPLAERIVNGKKRRGSFFCVGDGKQAIYGWRNGCAEIFDRLETDLPLLKEKTSSLTENYRSSKVILETVDEVFDKIAASPAVKEFSEAARMWRARYQKHTAHHATRPGYVELTTLSGESGGIANHDAEEEEEWPLAKPETPSLEIQRIAALHEKLPGASIGVLVRTNARIRTLLDGLRTAGVNAGGRGGTRLADDPAVTILLAALKLALHPGDTIAEFELASSPLKKFLGIRSRGPETREKISRLFREEILRDGLAEFLFRWGRKLAASCDERSARRLDRLIQIADREPPETMLLLRDFIRRVEETTFPEPREARVQVMTIHASKGLDFDIVVLPQLDFRLVETHKDSFFVCRDGSGGPIKYVLPRIPKTYRALSPELEQTYSQEEKRKLDDSLDLLYVAMTRARYALHLFIPPLKPKRKPAKKWEDRFGRKGWTDASAATILRHALAVRADTNGHSENEEGGETIFEAGDSDWYETLPPDEKANLLRKDTSRNKGSGPREISTAGGSKRRLLLRVSPSRLAEGGEIRAADLFRVGTHDRETRRGTLFHLWYSEIVWIEETDPKSERERFLKRAAEEVPDMDRKTAAALFEEFLGTLERAPVREVLARPKTDKRTCVEVWRERPFAVRLRDRIVSGTFDRVVVCRDDQERVLSAEIIDWKTGHDDPAAARERYAGQMEAYSSSLARILNLDEKQITTRLIFVDTERV